MSCPSCSAITRPEDRFCTSCGAGLEQRCHTCGTVLPTEARFCPSCGSSLAPEPPEGGIEPSGAERKVVSVLFADLVGFTASSDGADPEDVGRRLQPYHTALRREVEAFGGRIEKLMGDGVLAVFGAPVVHEDDAERAVRSGLRIQERVEGLAGSTGLRARVAIGTGEAVVLVGGTTMDREGLVGDVVNTASRLQGEAHPGTVLVDEATYRATRRAFQYEERPPVAVKGKASPIAVWVAVAPVARVEIDLDEDGTGLVGRSSELSLVIDAFTRAINEGTSQIVTIAGEPGVGKSRMVRELRRHVEGLPDLIRWRSGRCPAYGEGITYRALGEIIRAEAGVFDTDTPGTALGKLGVSLEPLLADAEERGWVAGRLAPLVGSDVEAAAEKAERFAAWHRYFAALGAQRPTVIVVEDLQWADANLVEFLAGVPEAARNTPLLLVCTARPDFFESHPMWGAGQRNAVTVRLEPLDAEATAELLDELLADGNLDEETREMVEDRCGGNPLWAQEFVRMLRDRSGVAADLAIPDTVQAVVASRIDLLGTETKTVIQAASTIGKSFWAGGVAELLDVAGGLEDSLNTLVRRELIRRRRVSKMVGETEYAFTHSVVRDVAYSQTPRVTRAERHRRLARWLERMAGERMADRAEVIAHHDAEALRLAAASDLEDLTVYAAAAASSHLRAARRVARFDLGAQRLHLEAALELIPPGDTRRGGVLLDLGEALFGMGMVDAGHKTLEEAKEELDRAGDLEGWGQAVAQLASSYWVFGDPRAAEQAYEEAIERLEQHPPGPALAAVYASHAGHYWLRGDSATALQIIDRVRHVVEVHGDLPARRRILSAEGGARFDMGDPGSVESFRQVLRTSVEADDSFGMAVAYLNLGEQLRTGWGVHEAISVHERGLEVAVHRRLSGTEQFLRQSLAVDLFLSGSWDESIRQLDAGLAIPERIPYLVAFRGPKIMIQVCRGEAADDTMEQMQGLIGEAEDVGDLQLLIPTYEVAMWSHFLLGDPAGATEHARGIVRRSGATRYLIDAWALTVWLLRRAGELDVIGDLLPQLRRFEMPRPIALVAVVEALLAEPADPAGAIVSIEEAAEQLAELGVVTDAAIALAEVSRIAEEVNETDRAADARTRAQELMSETQADLLLEKLGLV